MKFPLISFLTASAIWIIFIVTFFLLFEQNSKIITASLEVDSTIVDKVSKQVNQEKFLNNLQQKNEQKNISEKSLQEKVLQKNNILTKDSQKKQNSSNNFTENKIATITARPLPEIPEELRQEAFSSEAIARFYIAADGSFTVTLIKPCNNVRLNHLLLQSLRKWRFQPASSKLGSIDSVQDIKVNFRVE